MTFQERLLRLERKYKDLNKAICCVQNGGGGEALRFAVLTEDDVAAENRTFDNTGFTFEINADGGNMLNLSAGSANTRSATLSATAPDGAGTQAMLDLRAIDGGNFGVDLYAQNDDGSQWSDIYLSPNSLYIAHTDEIQIETGSGDLIFRLIEGTGFYVEYPLGTTFEINGVPQDDNADMILALDGGSNTLRWVDKATIGAPAGGSFFIDTDSVNVPNDASPVTIFSIPVQAGVGYAIELYLPLIHANGVGYNFEVLLPGSSTFFYQTWEGIGPASGGELDTLNIKRQHAGTTGTVFNMPATSFNFPAGSPVAKMTGIISSNDTAGNITLQVALDGAGPLSGAIQNGWMRITPLV